jgi:hypothetical protein
MQSVIVTNEANPDNATLTAVPQWKRELCKVQKYKQVPATKENLG